MARLLGRSGRPAALVILVALAIACGPPRSSTPPGSAAATQYDAYLCCTLRFNPSHEASDANYDYRDKTVFPAGTRVRVFKTTTAYAEFVPADDPTVYRIEFRYGRNAMHPGGYYGRLFVQDDPLSRLPSDASIRDAVREGRLVAGMTKEEALMARGYPPAHRTPSTDADEWLYYASYNRCERVRFANGRIASIEPTPPPS